MSRQRISTGQNFKVDVPQFRYDVQDPEQGFSLYQTVTNVWEDLTNNILMRRVGCGEQQRIDFDAVPDTGNYKITHEEQTTADLAYNASANDVQTAIEALSNINVGDIEVTGDYSAGFTVTFKGTQLGIAQAKLIPRQGTTTLTSSGSTVNMSTTELKLANSDGITIADSDNVVITHNMGSKITTFFIDTTTKERVTNLDYTLTDDNTLTVTNNTGSSVSIYILCSVEVPASYSEGTEYLELASDPSTPPANHVVIFSKNKKMYIKDSNGVTSEVGSGSSGVNYVSNPDAETGATIDWEVYADTAQTMPTDGIGGTPISTLVTSATDPLRGTRSFLFSKDAANRQGEGFSIPFTIEKADLNKQNIVSFDYTTDASTKLLGVYIYDINNTLIKEVVSDHSILGSGEWLGSFMSSWEKDYRLIFHIESQDATAIATTIDNVQIYPKKNLEQIVNWQPASETQEGVVTTGAQSFAGNKRFTAQYSFGGLIGGATRVFIKGIGSTTSTYSLYITNSSDQPTFYVNDAGYVYAPNLYSSTGFADLRFNTGTGLFFYDSSSIRYKQNIRKTDYSISDFLYKVNIVQYDRKDGSKVDEVGQIAEELFELNSALTFFNKNGEIEGYNKSDFIPYLIKEIQRSKAERDELKERIEKLEELLK